MICVFMRVCIRIDRQYIKYKERSQLSSPPPVQHGVAHLMDELYVAKIYQSIILHVSIFSPFSTCSPFLSNLSPSQAIEKKNTPRIFQIYTENEFFILQRLDEAKKSGAQKVCTEGGGCCCMWLKLRRKQRNNYIPGRGLMNQNLLLQEPGRKCYGLQLSQSTEFH